MAAIPSAFYSNLTLPLRYKQSTEQSLVYYRARAGQVAESVSTFGERRCRQAGEAECDSGCRGLSERWQEQLDQLAEKEQG